MRTSRGLFVVVLGPDGSGKSTVINRLSSELSQDFPHVVTFHLAPDLFRRRADSSPVTNPHGRPARSLLGSLAKIPYWLADYSVGYAVRVRPPLLRSSLVLFDRYFLDVLVDPKRYRYGGPRWPTSLVWRVIPKPDLVILLDAPSETLHSRKREVTFEETERQRNEYRKVVQGLSYCQVVNGALPVEDVVNTITIEIHECLAARQGQRTPVLNNDD